MSTETSLVSGLTIAPVALAPAIPKTLAEQFAELREATEKLHGELNAALSPPPAPSKPARSGPWWPLPSFFDRSKPKPALLPPPAPPTPPVNEVLARLKSADLAPTTLAALSGIAATRLDSGTFEGEQRRLLSNIVWRGQKQDLSAVEQAERWTTLMKAIDANKKGHESRFDEVSRTFKALTPTEQEGLAAIVRESAFDGEKPRSAVSFAKAKQFYAELVLVDPTMKRPRVSRELAAPEAGDRYAHLAREVLAFEAALARSINPASQSLEAAIAVRAAALDVSVGPNYRNALKVDESSLKRATDRTNEVLPAAAIADAIDRALAPWQDELTRTALSLVAKKFTTLLDFMCILGHDTRELLQRVADNVPKQSLDDSAVKLLAVLGAFNAIDMAATKPDGVRSAIATFGAQTLPEERPGLAAVFYERFFGGQDAEDRYFSGATELHRHLRTALERPAAATP